MEKALTKDKRVNWMLKQMEKAMPEVRRQVKVYEESLKTQEKGVKKNLKTKK